MAVPLHAQQRPAGNDADVKELAQYTLTMDALNRVDRVTKTAMALMEKDPRYAERFKIGKELAALRKKAQPTEAEQKRIEELEAKAEQLDQKDDPDDSDVKTLTDMEKKIDSMPPLATALKQEGMSAREYAKFTLASMQAALAAAVMKMPGAKKALPASINPANVTFVQEHEADFKRLQDTYASLGGD